MARKDCCCCNKQPTEQYGALIHDICEFFRFIKKKLHVHYYTKIIESQYSSFNYRNVVVECRCGKRDIQFWRHENVYPFPTASFITNKEMELIKNSGSE